MRNHYLLDSLLKGESYFKASGSVGDGLGPLRDFALFMIDHARGS
jgi:hypothetical protein